METNPAPSAQPTAETQAFDYSFVSTVSNIAVYDDALSGPRVIKIQPADTASYIEALAATIYQNSQDLGGSISYTIIREVSENFIHAQFKEVLVTIRDHGDTIIFADHGPGIPFKDKAQMPGFSSAVEPMRNYIRGVGSGLPIVREYLGMSHGTITIEDNLDGTGTVVTISVAEKAGEYDRTVIPDEAPYTPANAAMPASSWGATPSVPAEGYYPPAAGQFGNAQTAPAGSYAAAAPVAPQPAAAYPYPAAAQQGAVVQPGYQVVPSASFAQPAGVQPLPVQQYQQPVAYAAPVTYAVDGAVYGQVPAAPIPALSDIQQNLLRLLLGGTLSNKDIAQTLGAAPSHITNNFNKIADLGLAQKVGSKYALTPRGQQIAQMLP